MLTSTLEMLNCPARSGKKSCGGELELVGRKEKPLHPGRNCAKWRRRAQLPLLPEALPDPGGGVAILVEDVEGHLVGHVKGISQAVPDSAIPEPMRRDSYLEAKEAFEAERRDSGAPRATVGGVGAQPHPTVRGAGGRRGHPGSVDEVSGPDERIHRDENVGSGGLGGRLQRKKDGKSERRGRHGAAVNTPNALRYLTITYPAVPGMS
jgi:hypothetical protein